MVPLEDKSARGTIGNCVASFQILIRHQIVNHQKKRPVSIQIEKFNENKLQS